MVLMLLRPVAAAFADVDSLATGPEEPSLRTAFALFAALTLLLLLFVGGVALLVWLRSRRREEPGLPSRSSSEGVDADAWAEAGRRARAYPSQAQDE